MPPSDKHHSGATPAKPFTPTLSSAFRSSKSPLTPRLAGPATSNTSNVSRRSATIDSASTPNLTTKDNEISTPLSAFLSSNITPRSGSRKARVDSASSTPVGTPNGTPVQSRAASTIHTSRRASDHDGEWSGLGINAYDGQSKSQPQSAIIELGNYSAYNANGRADSASGLGDVEDVLSPSSATLFFHADDAKSAVSGSEPNVKPVLRAKATTFFYANGTADEGAQHARARSVPKEDWPPKSIIANGALSPRSPSPRALNTRSTSPPKQIPPLRPRSPLKESHSARPTPGHNRMLSRPNSTLQATQPVQNESPRAQPQSATPARRTSVSTNVTVSKRPISHTKSGSVGSTSSNPSRSSSLRVGSRPSSGSTNAGASTILNGTITTASPIPSPKAIDATPRAGVHSPSFPLSPARSSESSHGTSVPTQNDLAASARRERKVLDLEISNSSLLAINRTLEREMRKQNAELRRFRRLSRAGRLSIAPGPSSRAVSGLTTLSELDDPSSAFNPSPSSPTASEFSLDVSPMSSDDESSLLTTDVPLSPSTQAAHDLRHRRKDEARLLLDLSKHQQLLIDSQKMNQSIKRCLGWTEELIKEGQKALAYHVKVSDVELGGRVLVPDMDEESKEEEEAIGGGRLLSPSLEVERVLWPEVASECGSGSDEMKELDPVSKGRDPFHETDKDLQGGAQRHSTRDSSPFLSTPEDEEVPPESPLLLSETW